MTETVLAYRKPGADQAEAEKIANAAADALARRLVSDGFWIDREHRSYAYAFPDHVTHQQGKQALLAALDRAAPVGKSTNKLGWLRWLEVQD
ncbi:MAG: hypothetical protein ACRDLY_03710 [Thermoleophilaceae bacterium]